MRIAQVAPLSESVPPKAYGGTERVVHWLTEALVELGHEVTLFASADSQTRGRLIPVCSTPLRRADHYRDPLLHHVLLIERILERLHEFDVVHFHIDHLHYPVMRRQAVPYLTTLHGRLDLPDLPLFFETFAEAPLISISEAQRRPLPSANWLGTVHHGMPADLFRFSPGPGRYFAFLGRISREKRPDRAIQIARAAGVPLRIGAKIDPSDRDYFEAEIRPLLAGGGVEFLGELNDEEKSDLLRDAIALLFPVDWPEPFGLVLIEALACGTPVLGFRRGSVAEVIEDGVSGILVDTVEEAVEVAPRLSSLDRAACRRSFEARFLVERMAGDYLRQYARLLRTAPLPAGRPRVAL